MAVKEREPNYYWQRFERGKNYIYQKGLIAATNKNWNFYSGNQWDGIQSGGEELPMFNFIKPTIKYKVSTVSQNNMVANFSDAEGREDLQPVYEKLNTRFTADWEKANMDLELWATIKDAAVTGDGVQYYGTKNVEDMERIPNTNIMYGDESQPKVQLQPYIILWQRRSVRDVKAEALANGVPQSEIDLIVPDEETGDIVGNRSELESTNDKGESKVTCIVHMEKKDGVVHVCKTTKTVIYEPEHPIQVNLPSAEDVENMLNGIEPEKDENGNPILTNPVPARGLTQYPIVKIAWEDFPNDARGLSEVKQLIPNQLEINKTLARRSQIIKLTAFPRIAYDSNAISNPEDLEIVGAPIEITSGGVQSVNQMIAYLNPAQSNNDAKNYADDLLENTQELSGAGETAMGNINLNRVAASAVLAVRDQAALPLNEQVAKMKTFVEDLAKLWVELWAVYNPQGFDVVMEDTDPVTGVASKRVERVTKEDLDAMKPDIRIDTSQDNPWTKEAEQTWLDGVLEKQYITFEEYIEASPEHGIVPKSKMEVILERRKAQQQYQQMMMMQQQEEEMQRIAMAQANGDLDEDDDE